MKKMGSELIAKLAKIGAGAAVSAAVVVGACVADRSPRESAVVLSSIPESSVSAEYKSPASSSNSPNSPNSANSSIAGSYSASETSQIPETRNINSTKPYLVNINTATSRQLQELSGIGEAKAAAIIEYREMNGGFSDVSELLNVNGIGESVFENIRGYLTVGDAPPNKPSAPETSKPPSTTSTPPANISIVNINTASLEEFQKLPGIGPVKAMAIVQYRSVFGEFTDINELKNVNGIGESVFAEIRDYITVGNDSSRPVENTPQVPERNEKPEKTEEIYVNINTATLSELCEIPGIGSVKAQAIISYREDYGDFYSIDEIKNVSGIGDKTFESIREYIYVESRERFGNNQNPENSEKPAQSGPAVNYPVNLNTATLEELCSLPDIGEEKAMAIIQFRIDHGGFNDIRELQHISGIGLDTIQKLRYITTV